MLPFPEIQLRFQNCYCWELLSELLLLLSIFGDSAGCYSLSSFSNNTTCVITYSHLEFAMLRGIFLFKLPFPEIQLQFQNCCEALKFRWLNWFLILLSRFSRNTTCFIWKGSTLLFSLFLSHAVNFPLSIQCILRFQLLLSLSVMDSSYLG